MLRGKSIVGLVIAGTFAMSTMACPTSAQTTGAGPYYANPSWDQQLPAAQRFIVLSNWGGKAVLDRETGLVWQRSPNTESVVWGTAAAKCRQVGIPGVGADGGGRLGWRLPSIEELQSLLDLTQSNPTLPAGHPFQSVQSHAFDFYWTGSTVEDETDARYVINFNDGVVAAESRTDTRAQFWCVRGGSGTVNPS